MPAAKSTPQVCAAAVALLLLLQIVRLAPATSLSGDGGKSIRVLLVQSNSSALSALEEAAALSIDSPTRGEANQTSLASLTLHQLAASTTSDSPPSAHSAPPQAKAAEPWTEVHLPRLKPSWLNVSSRFKITGSSIDELQYFMPAEFMLRQAFDAPILLKTRLGVVEGVRSIKFNKHLYTFLSIPYARAPVGELRFKAPKPVERWEGILQTTKWPPFCVQPSMTLASKSSPVHVLTQIMSEDCLYLNIWTPSLKLAPAPGNSSAPNGGGRRRPVMVWLHGGAFQYGGISVDENDGSALALAGDVVVVTLNYRVSAFGFLNANNRDEAPNNVGLLDQQLALKWVQENIKQFGGDPQQVTLFGESAGGHSVGLHLISPASQPLFKRAILQSGVPISFLRSYDVNTDNSGPAVAEAISSVMMAKRLRCWTQPPPAESTTPAEPETATVAAASANATAPDQPEAEEDEAAAPYLNSATLDCMRQKSSLEILKAMGAPGNAGFFPTGNDPKGFFPNGPIMDSFDGENLKIGSQKDYLIGTNIDEGTFMLHFGMPALFPAKEAPKVTSVEALKNELQAEIERVAKSAAEQQLGSGSGLGSKLSASAKLDIQSASGASAQNGGAQAHLYKPLLRTSTSVLENFMPKSTRATNVTQRQLSKEAEFGNNIGSLITDIIFLCPARALARTLSDAQRNVYFYLYAHRSSRSSYHEWIGVTHHDEVEFVFGRPLRLADVYSGKDVEMSQRLIKVWSNFAYTGQMLDQSGTKWPKYDAEDNNYMILGGPNEGTVGQRYHDRVCNIYETVISVHLQDN